MQGFNCLNWQILDKSRACVTNPSAKCLKGANVLHGVYKAGKV